MLYALIAATGALDVVMEVVRGRLIFGVADGG